MGLDMARLRHACEALAADKALIRRFALVDGGDGAAYVNLMFDVTRPRDLWDALWRELYQSPSFGAQLQQASMAMCQGRQGWDDYRLLHHYDPTVPREACPEG